MRDKRIILPFYNNEINHSNDKTNGDVSGLNMSKLNYKD